MVRDEFDEHQRRLRDGFGADLSIKCINGCHKFILAARTTYFQTKFQSKWANKSRIVCKGMLITLNSMLLNTPLFINCSFDMF